jgi:hypothetical protein
MYFYNDAYLTSTETDPVTPDEEWHYVTLSIVVASGLSNFIPIIGIDGSTSSTVSISSGEYFEITGVQLELGKVATPFEHRSYGEELALCQRYFERQTFSGAYQFVCNSINTNTTQVEGFIPFMVEKRSSPTVTSSAASTWRVNALVNDVTASSISWFSGTVYGVRGQWTRSSGTHVIREASYVNVENTSPYEAYINIDSEL